jgi:hypothetical protein
MKGAKGAWAKNPQVQQAASSLLRFTHKTPKNRLQGDFLPCKLPKQPINRDFCVTGGAKIHKCNRLLEIKAL